MCSIYNLERMRFEVWEDRKGYIGFVVWDLRFGITLGFNKAELPSSELTRKNYEAYSHFTPHSSFLTNYKYIQLCRHITFLNKKNIPFTGDYQWADSTPRSRKIST